MIVKICSLCGAGKNITEKEDLTPNIGLEIIY